MKKLALAVSLVAISSASAFAADLATRPYTKAPAFVEANNWSGIYIGGQVGYDWAVNKYTYNNGAGVIEDFNQSQVSNSGTAAGGGHIGVQGQFGNWVLGLEGEYNALSLKQNDVSAVIAGGPLRTLKTDGIASVTGKLGYSFDTWMIYGKGGWAEASITTSALNPPAAISVKKWQSGVTAGIGIDHKIMQNWVGSFEFDYYNFKFDRTAANSLGAVNTWSNSSTNIYSLMFKLAYLFNWGSPVVAKY